jgi:hypothetical protein
MATYKNLPKEKIDDVYFAYTCISKPSKKYKAETTEYKTTVVLSKEQRKVFKAIRVEGQAINKTLKEVPTDQFFDQYKFEAPYQDQDDQYVLSIAQDTHSSKTKELYPDFLRPRAYFAPGGDMSQIQDITSTEIGNGSFGTLRYSQLEGENGISIKLNAILLKTLVPFTSKSGDDWASAAGTTFATAEKTPTSETKVASSSHSAPVEDDDDDLPF